MPVAEGCADGREDGLAGVLVLALATLVALIGSVLVAGGAVAVTRARAAGAADLGALAAAAQTLEGPQVACRRAAVVVSAAGAELVSCRPDGDVVEVEVRLRPAGPLGRWGAARGRARAGPARATLPGVAGQSRLEPARAGPEPAEPAQSRPRPPAPRAG